MNIFDVNQIHHAMEQVAFFRQDNMAYYAMFFNERPDLSPERVVLYVNIGLHYDFYERVFYVADSYQYTVLVNKFFRNAASFSPSDLVAVAPGHYLRQSAATAFLDMQAHMYAQGLPIVARSAYRSYQTQRDLFNRNVANMGQAWADMWNARPGHSEHQLGLAIDVLQPGQGGVSLGAAGFDQTPQYTWMLQNAHNFGFILSYPEAYTHVTGYAYEPWHWRYVGIETASYMSQQGIPTLDHYWATRVAYVPSYITDTNYIVTLNTEQNTAANSGNAPSGSPETSTTANQAAPVSATGNGTLPDSPETPTGVEHPLSVLNPVLFSLGQTEVTAAHGLSTVLAVLIGLMVFARVQGIRRRRRRRLARQYDFASRMKPQARPTRQRGSGNGHRRAR